LLKFFKKWIDRSAIDVAAKSLPPGVSNALKALAAQELLNAPDLLRPPAEVARLSMGRDQSFQFESAEKNPGGRNATVHGRMFLTKGPWATRPFVTLVHGWNAELHYMYVLPRVARALNKAGLNAALIELPFHLHRRPLERNGMRDFVSDDLPGMLFATRQAIADIDSLTLWSRAQGCPRTAVWGFSLGAWLAGLYICHSDVPDAAVLTTPISNLARAVAELSFCHPVRSGMCECPLDLSPLNLNRHQPRIPLDSIQVVQSTYDLFVPSETYSELATAWKLNGWEEQRQGHISILLSRRAMRQSIDFLASRLCSSIPTSK
jgi:dienelactone hydrolase